MAQTAPETVVYVSNAGDPSIHMLAMNRASGEFELIDKVAIPETDKPSPTSMPLALSPDRRFLYAALRSEPFTVVSFAIDKASGKLSHLGNAPLEASMAYTTVDRTGKWLLAASYPQGKLTVNPIADGKVEAPPSQIISDRPKAHSVIVDAANKNAYCAVLEQDLILQLKLDPASGKVTPNNPAEIKTKPGAGPRHMAIHPNGRFLYLITETTATVGAFAIDKNSGALKELQFLETAPPGGYKEQPAAADLHVTPDGKFLYGSERKTSSLIGFRIDPNKGTLTYVGRWPTETKPRGFGIEPRGKFLLSVGLDSNHLTVCAIQPDGKLSPVKQHATGKQPNWIEFVDLR
jgi:6-phosphogluconolactonase